MAVRKNRPVLFEVVAKTQRTRRRGLSLWSATPSTAPPPAPPSPAATPMSHEPPAESPSRPRTFSVATGRVHLALGWLHLTALGVLAVVILVAVYRAGARSGQPPAPSTGELDFLMAEPPRTTPEPQPTAAPPTPARGRPGGAVVTPLAPFPEPPRAAEPAATESGPPTEPPGESFAFVADSYYVVAQHFPRRARAAADAARDFLRSKGIECVVHGGAGDWMLVATQRFATERDAARLQARIRELGREYFVIGRYDFKDAAARKF